MADKDKEEPRMRRTLNDRQVAERKNTLTLLSIEKMKLERECDKIRDELKPKTAQMTMLDQQIYTIATEIDEKAAWIPKQLALGEDPNAEPAPGASKLPRSAKKKRRGSNGVDTGAAELPDDSTAG